MRKTEEQKMSWQERKKTIKHKWLRPLIFVEWLCERISYFLGRWAFLDILGHAGRLVILIAVIMFFVERDERKKAKHYQAWQVINVAQGKPGGGGRKDALEDLHKDAVTLVGVDISKAYLRELNLSGADLRDTNLSGAYLLHANLSGADLSGAYLSEADLRYANLLNIREWKDVKSIELANIYDVNNPPDGFIEWAKEHRAVEINDINEWKALLDE